MKVKITRIGDIVIIDDGDKYPVIDYFLASQVRSITVEWRNDKSFTRIAFVKRGHIDWNDVETSDVARVVWPELAPPETLLQESER